jgi:hypothetical protein
VAQNLRDLHKITKIKMENFLQSTPWEGYQIKLDQVAGQKHPIEGK